MLTALVYLNKRDINVYRIEFHAREGRLKFIFKYYYNDMQHKERAGLISVYNNNEVTVSSVRE